MAPHFTRPFTVALAAMCFIAVGAPFASAHFLSTHSVDSGEIRYGDSTQYDDSRTWAINRFNDMPDGVNVAPDDAWHYEDLTFSDYSANDGWCGYWQSSAGADDLKLNSNYYSGASQTDRRACTLHELGHAHGLDHSYSDQVMDSCPVSSCYSGGVYNYLQSHDQADYNTLW